MPDVHYPDGHTLHFHKTGTGKTVVLWFHGFGQNHLAFNKIIEPDQQEFTHYIFDLFYHGNSVWASNTPIKKHTWKELIQRFLDENGITQFHVVAFSIGCRFGVTIAEQFPNQVQTLTLLAPDGIQFRFWYALVTYPYLSRKLFHRIVTKPALWNRLLSVLEFTRIIDRKLLRFAQRQMDSEQKRSQVYNSWVNFRHLKSHATKLGQLANHYKMHITLVAGTRDKIVPATLVQKLQYRMPQLHYHSLNANHNELIGMSSNLIFKLLHNQ